MFRTDNKSPTRTDRASRERRPRFHRSKQSAKTLHPRRTSTLTSSVLLSSGRRIPVPSWQIVPTVLLRPKKTKRKRAKRTESGLTTRLDDRRQTSPKIYCMGMACPFSHWLFSRHRGELSLNEIRQRIIGGRNSSVLCTWKSKVFKPTSHSITHSSLADFLLPPSSGIPQDHQRT